MYNILYITSLRVLENHGDSYHFKRKVFLATRTTTFIGIDRLLIFSGVLLYMICFHANYIEMIPRDISMTEI